MISLFKEVRSVLLTALVIVMILGQGSASEVQAQDATPTPTATQIPFGINTPTGGEALQGVVAITGTTQAAGFQAAEVSFAYASGSTGTWFLIEQVGAPVIENQIAAWDTTTISDGMYHLRLQVFLSDGTVLEKVVENVRVRNYTAVETSTPPAPGETVLPTRAATARPTSTPAVDFVAAGRTPEPLPTNPARLSSQNLRESAAVGVGAVAAVLLTAAIYLTLRALFRR